MLRNFSWMIEGRLAGMAMPTGAYAGFGLASGRENHAELRRDLQMLKTEGVTAIVSLTHRALHRKTVEQAGLQSFHLPIEDMTPPTLEQIQRFVEYIDGLTEKGGRAVVHCSAGMGRTGTMLACYLVWTGMSAENAIQEVRTRRPGSIETFEQEAAVEAYAARVAETASIAREMRDSVTNMGEIRSAKREEFDQVIEVCAAAYTEKAGYDRRPDFERRLASDPEMRFVDNRILLVDGEVVSALRVYALILQIGVSRLRCAGIGDVATLPDEQGKGYASRLIRDTLTYLQARKFDMAWLTGRSDFYSRFGWVDCPGSYIEIETVSAVSDIESDCEVKPLDFDRDAAVVREIYDTFNDGRTCTVDRSPAYWDWLARYRPVWNHDRLILRAAHRDGNVVGYLFAERRGGECHLLEVGCMPTDTDVVAVLIANAAVVAAREGFDKMHGIAPVGVDDIERLCRAGVVTRMHTEDRMMWNVMINILDPVRFLKQLAPELIRRMTRASHPFWSGRIGLANEHGARAVLTVEPQAVHIDDLQQADVEVTMESTMLVPMLMGYRAFKNTPRISPRSLPKQVRRLMSTLFPPVSPVYWGTDYI